MSAYAIPFWEHERGDGPVTRQLQSRMRIAAAAELREVEHDLTLYIGNLDERETRTHKRLLQRAAELRTLLGIVGEPPKRWCRYTGLRARSLCTVCRRPSEASRCPSCAEALAIRRRAR